MLEAPPVGSPFVHESDIPVPAATLITEAIRMEDDWRWDAALDAWDRARLAATTAVAVEGADRLLGESESGRARALFALGRHEDADQADRAAAGRFAAAGEPALAKLCEASSARRIGATGRVDDALALAEEARDAIDALRDDPEAIVAGARARQVLARLLFAVGRVDEGEREYLEARDRFADAGDDRRLCRCDAALALDLVGAGRFEDAEGRAEAALAGLMMLDCVVDGAQLQLVVGRLQAEGERHEEALVNFRAAHAVFSARALWPAAAEAVHLEALVLAAMGQDELAIDRFREAIAVAVRAGMDGGEGTSRLEMALVLAQVGQLEASAAEFELAAAALGRAGDTVGAARAAYGLGTARRQLGDLQGALGAFSDAAASFAASGVPGAQAQALFDGGAVLAQMGRTDDALGRLDQAAAGFAVDGEPLHRALVRRAWGAIAGFASRPEGLAALSEARATFAEEGAAWDVAECDAVTARVLGSLGRPVEALVTAEAAAAGFRALDDPVAEVAAETMVGRLLAETGMADDAIGHLQSAIAGAVASGAEPLAAQAHEALAEVLEALDRGAEAAVHRDAAQRLIGADDQERVES